MRYQKIVANQFQLHPEQSYAAPKLAAAETDAQAATRPPVAQKKKMLPGPDLLLQVEKAFLDSGYGGLSMIGLAKACEFSARALYYYFDNKEEAFRASVRYRNDVGLSVGYAAGRERRAAGDSALDIFTAIIDARFGDLRRMANASPHLTELNAQVFKRCIDIVMDVALSFEAELARLVVEFEAAGLLRLKAGMSADHVARGLANGARGVNQRLPPIPPDQLAESYREMCGFILYGCAELP
jgi:AcrR family transcriptional regulator